MIHSELNQQTIHGNPQRFITCLLIISVVSLFGCGGSSGNPDNNNPTPVTQPTADPVSPTDPEPGPEPQPDPDDSALFKPEPDDLVEIASIYKQDGYNSVEAIRVDLRTITTDGICTVANYSGCTLADVIADTSNKDDYKPRINVHFQSDDFADDGSISNAELRQRGGSTRSAPQKSFRVKLDDKNTLWRNERSLLLNKHPNEPSRIRNKLSFDLMSEIPHLLSSRTQFVNLWLDNGAGPVDYGFFTHVEAPGSNYLDKRGRSRDDRLYKAEFFRFVENDLKNVGVDAIGKPLDQGLFESALEIEAGEDHRPLVGMLSAFHDPNRTFESFLDEYFNHNNVLTWMAVNLLLHQTDAVTHNFILYNPEGSKKFYFLPWDYDGSFDEEIEPVASDYSNSGIQKRLFYGYARGINNEFITRYYRLPGIHDKMIEAAEYLRQNYLTDSNIAEKANQYATVALPFMLRHPDNQHIGNYSLNRVEHFPRHVARNLEALRSRFSVPLPPTLEDPVLDGTQLLFSWDPAFDVTGHSLSYELQISTSLEFTADSIVLANSGIADDADKIEHRIQNSRFLPGQYYVRVIARASNEPERFWQMSRNVIRQDGGEFYGAVEFTVN